MRYLTVVKFSVIRYIQVDLKYKFQLLTDAVWFSIDILTFTILGGIFDTLADPKLLLEAGIDYNFKNFLLVGVLFWAFFHRSYEDTVNNIPEEASRGTIGFLVTNNINISTLLIARNIASSVKTAVMTVVFIFPPLLLLGVFRDISIYDLPYILISFAICWFFMLAVSVMISSLNIIFKRITPLALMILYGLKVFSGYYFPLEVVNYEYGNITGPFKAIPIVKGLYLVRDLVANKNTDMMATFSSMIIGTFLMLIVAYAIYKFLERVSQKRGSLEFY